MVITDKDGKLGHSEMRFGDGLIYVGRARGRGQKQISRQLLGGHAGRFKTRII